jgi:hypothetical protein
MTKKLLRRVQLEYETEYESTSARRRRRLSERTRARSGIRRTWEANVAGGGLLRPRTRVKWSASVRPPQG